MADLKDIHNEIGLFIKTGKNINIKNTNYKGFLKYRELIYNNFESAIETAFPITKNIISENDWNFLVRDFFENHNAKYHEIWRMPKEFIEYCKNNEFEKKLKKPFLLDLLNFEWIEIEIFNMPDKIFPKVKKTGNIQNDILVVNPENILQIYEYPVNKININSPSLKKQQTIIVSYRHPETKNAEFVLLSKLDALIFEKITVNKLSLNDAFIKISKEFKQDISKEIKNNSINIFTQLLQNKLFIGFIKQPLSTIK